MFLNGQLKTLTVPKNMGNHNLQEAGTDLIQIELLLDSSL